MSGPLDDSRAKLGRAKLHIDCLRASIREAGQGDPYTIPLREDLDQDTGTLYFRVDRIPSQPEYWGLLIGDTLHNLRSALDNGWWQLACHHLKRTPTEEEAKKIQFPILKPGGTWNEGSVKKWVGPVAAKFTGELQPDPGGYAPDVFHPLATLNRLSNVDKHRNIHPTVHLLHELRVQIRPEGTDGAVLEGLKLHHPGPRGRAPQAGDDILWTDPGFASRYPKVKLDAHQTGFVAIDGGRQSILTVLDDIGAFAEATLAGFSHILAGKQPPKPELALGPKRI
jgi:hypothetical protein